jgi:hypothetical protein
MCKGLFSDINYILSFNLPYVIFGILFPRDFTGRVPPVQSMKLTTLGFLAPPDAPVSGFLISSMTPVLAPKFPDFAKLFSL